MNGQPLLSPVLPRSEASERSLVLEVSGLTKVYRSRLRTITAFENIAFSLNRGEIAVILGPSGCGKSSFLKTVAGLERATRGSVRALNQTVSAPIPQFGFVFQQPVLFPWLNVRQNVGFALALKSGPRLQKERRNQAIYGILSDVGLSQASHARPRQLSGAWIVLVPAEMLGVRAGLGYYILDARDRLSYSELMAVILIIGLIGYGLDTLLRLAQRAFSAED